MGLIAALLVAGVFAAPAAVGRTGATFDAEAKLVTHLTTGEKAKFPDGHEEEHKIVKTSPPKDNAQVKNLVQWILAQ